MMTSVDQRWRRASSAGPEGRTPHRRNRVPNRVPDSAFLMPLRDTHSNEKACKRTGRSSGMPLVTWGSRVRVPLPALPSGRDDTSARAPRALFLSESETYPSATQRLGSESSVAHAQDAWSRPRQKRGRGRHGFGIAAVCWRRSQRRAPARRHSEPPFAPRRPSRYTKPADGLAGLALVRSWPPSGVRRRVPVGPRAALAQPTPPSRY